MTPALVTLHLWTLPRSHIPWAMLRMATDRGRVRRAAGVSFAKLLGTGRGRTFLPGDADLGRWALLTCWTDADAARGWERSPTAAQWRSRATETWRAELRPLRSRGSWSGREPFGAPRPERHDGTIAVLTRARLRPRTALTFRKAVPPIAAELHEAGARLALGIGELPIGLQGTFSVWQSEAALREFAYSTPAHVQAVADTERIGWYSEELFARFAVLDSAGTVDGVDPAA